jgi:hypothetical protein
LFEIANCAGRRADELISGSNGISKKPEDKIMADWAVAADDDVTNWKTAWGRSVTRNLRE